MKSIEEYEDIKFEIKEHKKELYRYEIKIKALEEQIKSIHVYTEAFDRMVDNILDAKDHIEIIKEEISALEKQL